MEHPFAPQTPKGSKPRRRDYEKVLATLEARWKRRAATRAKIMQEIVDALWEAFGGAVYSWCGFYSPGAGGQDMSLGPHRDRPACTPIGMNGVCGKAALTRACRIVADVKALPKEEYVECHPETRSEIVVPVIDLKGHVMAVLDIDSIEPNAFAEEDRRWLERILRHLESTPSPAESAS